MELNSEISLVPTVINNPNGGSVSQTETPATNGGETTTKLNTIETLNCKRSSRGSDASDISAGHLMVSRLYDDDIASRKSSISFDKIKQISLTYSLQSEDDENSNEQEDLDHPVIGVVKTAGPRDATDGDSERRKRDRKSSDARSSTTATDFEPNIENGVGCGNYRGTNPFDYDDSSSENASCCDQNGNTQTQNLTPRRGTVVHVLANKQSGNRNKTHLTESQIPEGFGYDASDRRTRSRPQEPPNQDNFIIDHQQRAQEYANQQEQQNQQQQQQQQPHEHSKGYQIPFDYEVFRINDQSNREEVSAYTSRERRESRGQPLVDGDGMPLDLRFANGPGDSNSISFVISNKSDANIIINDDSCSEDSYWMDSFEPTTTTTTRASLISRNYGGGVGGGGGSELGATDDIDDDSTNGGIARGSGHEDSVLPLGADYYPGETEVMILNGQRRVLHPEGSTLENRDENLALTNDGRVLRELKQNSYNQGQLDAMGNQYNIDVQRNQTSRSQHEHPNERHMIGIPIERRKYYQSVGDLDEIEQHHQEQQLKSGFMVRSSRSSQATSASPSRRRHESDGRDHQQVVTNVITRQSAEWTKRNQEQAQMGRIVSTQPIGRASQFNDHEAERSFPSIVNKNDDSMSNRARNSRSPTGEVRSIDGRLWSNTPNYMQGAPSCREELSSSAIKDKYYASSLNNNVIGSSNSNPLPHSEMLASQVAAKKSGRPGGDNLLFGDRFANDDLSIASGAYVQSQRRVCESSPSRRTRGRSILAGDISADRHGTFSPGCPDLDRPLFCESSQSNDLNMMSATGFRSAGGSIYATPLRKPRSCLDSGLTDPLSIMTSTLPYRQRVASADNGSRRINIVISSPQRKIVATSSSSGHQRHEQPQASNATTGDWPDVISPTYYNVNRSQTADVKSERNLQNSSISPQYSASEQQRYQNLGGERQHGHKVIASRIGEVQLQPDYQPRSTPSSIDSQGCYWNNIGNSYERSSFGDSNGSYQVTASLRSGGRAYQHQQQQRNHHHQQQQLQPQQRAAGQQNHHLNQKDIERTECQQRVSLNSQCGGDAKDSATGETMIRSESNNKGAKSRDEPREKDSISVETSKRPENLATTRVQQATQTFVQREFQGATATTSMRCVAAHFMSAL